MPLKSLVLLLTMVIAVAAVTIWAVFAGGLDLRVWGGLLVLAVVITRLASRFAAKSDG